MDSYDGYFVAFEGIDGSGKTTQLQFVEEKLKDQGLLVHITSEPSSGKLGPILREYLSDPTSRSETDALLFAADRVEHYYQEILPNLKEGKIVITDRYKMSSVIYQGLEGLSDDWIVGINDRVPNPDLTLIFDLPAEIALNRVSSDRSHLEKFETKEMLKKLLNRYRVLELGQKEVINANQEVQKITDDITQIIITQISKNKKI